ncbi:MAG: DUF4135 domain-containing protein, partial [Parachlamydiaceae bacterium]
KPRSMLAEEVVVGQEGLFSSIINSPDYKVWQQTFKYDRLLSNYTVLNKGKYGYCQFIENKKNENTIDIQDIDEYVIRFFLLERIAFELGMADLHAGNIIVCMLCPTLIDGEVVMIPRFNKSYVTDLLGDYDRAGVLPHPEEHNQIWIVEELSPSEVRGLVKSAYLTILENQGNRIHQEDQKAIKKIIRNNQKSIEKAKNLLESEHHRFVLISTEQLNYLISGRLSFEDALNELYVCIKMGLEKWGGNFEEINKESVKQQFEKDFFNNDTPIFYISSKGIIYYSTAHIGKVPISPSESSSD